MAVKKGCLDCKAIKTRECANCHSIRMAAWRAKKIGEGFCSRCCKKPPVFRKKMCSICILDACLRISFKGYPEEAERARVAVHRFNGVCQCCGKTNVTKPCIEHDHANGKFRGIVCGGCNLVMGVAQDRPEYLSAVISYLKNPPAYGMMIVRSDEDWDARQEETQD